MEDWDAARLPSLDAKEQSKNKWDDEDVEEDDVKESWEDEDEPAAVALAVAPPPPPPHEEIKKPLAKPVSMKKGKDGALDEESKLADPVAEKLQQQRLVEEADYRAAAELFSKKGEEEKTIDNFIPKSDADFVEYAELVSHKLRPYEKSFHYISLLKSVMRLSMTALKAADAKDIASSITVIANEKLKAEKEINAARKKTGGKKKQLQVDKMDDFSIAFADSIDDDDFM